MKSPKHESGKLYVGTFRPVGDSVQLCIYPNEVERYHDMFGKAWTELNCVILPPYKEDSE